MVDDLPMEMASHPLRLPSAPTHSHSEGGAGGLRTESGLERGHREGKWRVVKRGRWLADQGPRLSSTPAGSVCPMTHPMLLSHSGPLPSAPALGAFFHTPLRAPFHPAP